MTQQGIVFNRKLATHTANDNNNNNNNAWFLVAYSLDAVNEKKPEASQRSFLKMLLLGRHYDSIKPYSVFTIVIMCE